MREQCASKPWDGSQRDDMPPTEPTVRALCAAQKLRRLLARRRFTSQERIHASELAGGAVGGDDAGDGGGDEDGGDDGG